MSAPSPTARSEPIVAVSAAMKRILHLVERIAPTESNILLTGESGTGKEKVARLIHFQSRRSRGPFVAVNMAAIPETLIESEMFGHVRGAFTDARRDRRGFFELADRGTLFLDEIAEMSPGMQVKLLRVLQNREVQPVGAEAVMRVDTRVVAATNRDLRAEIAAKRFRDDLFYRLNVFHLHIPPLRDRKDDIPPLVRFFLEQASARLRKRVTGISDGAWSLLMTYAYPGNVRELENAIERALVLADEGSEIKVWDLPPEIAEQDVPRLTDGRTPAATDDSYAPDLTLREVEARHIRRVIRQQRGNLTRAAKILGISRTTLWRKIKAYGIEADVP